MTIWRMRNACWITKAADTHSENVILISFSLQQWLHERTSTLRYTYTDGLVCKQATLQMASTVVGGEH